MHCEKEQSVRIESKAAALFKTKGSRKLSLQIDSVVNEILKILILHKFTEEELEIILDLVRYRITGTDYIFRRSTRKGEQ